VTRVSEPDDRAAEFPDVEHPEPATVPESAFMVPPPITERQSRLLNVLHDYRDDKQDWDVTRSELVAFPYAAKPKPGGQPVGPGAGEWYADVEAEALGPAPDDSWAQLMEACAAGMLTRAERDEVLREILKRADADTAGVSPAT
jgi:hypothetical protein